MVDVNLSLFHRGLLRCTIECCGARQPSEDWLISLNKWSGKALIEAARLTILHTTVDAAYLSHRPDRDHGPVSLA